MKRELSGIIIVVLSLGIAFSGCFGENNQKQINQQNEELITASILNLLLTIEDLPEGYSENYSGIEYTSEFSSGSNETFTIWFSKGNISNPDEYDLITCELNKFNSIEEAEIAYSTIIEYMMTIGNFEVIDGSIDVIGRESKAITKNGYNDFLTFRISNVIGVMSSTNYSFTIDLAKIVEQRIYNSTDSNVLKELD